MSKVILVTGSNTLTGRKLIEKLLSQDYSVVTPIPGKDNEQPETGTRNLTVLNWNRGSWFSTKTLVREIQRIHGSLDAAFIINHHTPERISLDEVQSSNVENLLDNSVKSYVALVRELVSMPFRSGTDERFMGMVIPYRSGGGPGPLDALADGAYKGFASSVVKSSFPGWWNCGFVNNSVDTEGFAESVIDNWNKLPAKLQGCWFSYAEGKRPFRGSGIVNSIK